ncbi:MAG TPA: protein kinase [Gemmatimonadaceae bacterium]|nr:protein kinase [Gemmatimonadaceae bacterium]
MTATKPDAPTTPTTAASPTGGARPEAGRARSSHRLAWTLYLGTAAVVTIVLAVTLIVLTLLAARTADTAVSRGLEQTRQHVRALLDGRERSLASGALVFAQGPVFRSLVIDARPEDLRDQAAEAVERIGATWVQITDGNGVRLAKSDEPTAAADTLSGSALIGGALSGDVATGFGVAGDTALVQTAAVPIAVGQARAAGVLMAAQVIDTAFARSIRDATASEIIFYLLERDGTPRIAVTTLSDSTAIRSLLSGISTDSAAGDGPPLVEMGGQHFVALAEPLLSAGGDSLGGFVALRSRDAEMAPFAALRRSIALVGLLGLGAAAALAFVLTRQIIRPLRALADATRRAAAGDYGANVEVHGDDEIGSLAAAMRSMLSDLHERQVLSDFLAEPSGVEATRESRGERARREAIESVTAAPSALQTGALLAGRYRIAEVLGVGGNGVVYKATDIELGEAVAVKTLRPGSMLEDPVTLERLKSEIRLARRISHRNVVRIHDLGEADGMYFITMEYVAGTPLNELIDRRAPIAVSSTLAIAKQLCRALEVAHEQGIIHRDIKPSNIIVQPDGVLKVMDFGVARPITRSSTMTQAGMVVGTPAYMAPEQLAGESVDARADLFSVGVVLYECLTRRRPFDAWSPTGLLGQALTSKPPAPHDINPQVPRPLSSLVMSVLSSAPAQRPASAAELREKLSRLR